MQAEEHPRPDFNEMIHTTIDLLLKYSITSEGRSRIFVDGANPSFGRALKTRVSENYELLTAQLKISVNFGLQSLALNVFVISITSERNTRW